MGAAKGADMDRKKIFLSLFIVAFLTLLFLPEDAAHSQDKSLAAPATRLQGQDKPPLASPEEFKSYLDAERQAIAREREALLFLRTQVRQEVEKLQSLQAQIDERFAKEDAQQDDKIKKMVKIYSTMRPEEVGPLLSKFDEDLVVKIFSNMKPKTQAELLARMSPDKAAAISKKIMSREAK